MGPNTYTVTVTDANGCTATLSQAITQPNALALTIGTVTNVNCNGNNNGAININVAGGHNSLYICMEQWSDYPECSKPCSQYVYCNCYRC
ncbi:MAG: hypothetical protein IPP29_06730 [Bacteroidetes bacterium]|nr:hypothetical protein [Bacteroidota bacterium]